MIGELQRSGTGPGRRTVPGPVSPELLLFAPQPEKEEGEAAFDWELVSQVLRAYQQIPVINKINVFLVIN